MSPLRSNYRRLCFVPALHHRIVLQVYQRHWLWCYNFVIVIEEHTRFPMIVVNTICRVLYTITFAFRMAVPIISDRQFMTARSAVWPRSFLVSILRDLRDCADWIKTIAQVWSLLGMPHISTHCRYPSSWNNSARYSVVLAGKGLLGTTWLGLRV